MGPKLDGGGGVSRGSAKSPNLTFFFFEAFPKFADHVIWVQKSQREVYLFMGHPVFFQIFFNSIFKQFIYQFFYTSEITQFKCFMTSEPGIHLVFALSPYLNIEQQQPLLQLVCSIKIKMYFLPSWLSRIWSIE